MTSRVLVVRHAETTWNAEHRWAGHSDPPLSAVGESQAVALGAALAGTGIERIVASDLARARATADAVRAACGLADVAIDGRLRERGFGPWEGRTSAEIEDGWPGLLDGWRNGTSVEVPGGEPWPAFSGRLADVLLELSAFDGTTLVVTHGGAFRVVEQVFGVPFRRVANTCGVALTFGPGRFLTTSDVSVVGVAPPG